MPIEETILPRDMEHLTEFIQSLIDTKGKLPPDQYQARLDEVMRIDRGSKVSEAQGCQGWVSEQIRSRYFASIMHGRILIGS